MGQSNPNVDLLNPSAARSTERNLSCDVCTVTALHLSFWHRAAGTVGLGALALGKNISNGQAG